MARFARTNPHPDLFAGLVQEPLARSESDPAPPTATPITPTVQRKSPLWIAIYLPALALQARQDDCDKRRACVVVEDDPLQRIVATNKAARRAGVIPGQALRSALALEGELQILERQLEAETALLGQLAHRLLSFTNNVSLQPPYAVLLEVSGSLRLFGGITSLQDKLMAALQDQQFFFRCSVAPTAQAAYWFAKLGIYPCPDNVAAQSHHCPAVQRALNALDISVTDWSSDTVQALSEMGVRTLADCRRLPRAGVLRRFGPAVLQSLAQAFGELPEVREYIREPEQFTGLQQLDAEISEAPQLAEACQVLLQQLVAFCRRHQSAVQSLQFRFHAWRGNAGALNVPLSSPGYQRQHWERLLAAHLERCVLQQPAVAVSLQAEASGRMTPQSAGLALMHADPVATVADQQGTYEFLDQLRARLGDEAVSALQHVNSHCPSTASRTIAPSSAQSTQATLPSEWQLHDATSGLVDSVLWRQRPLWLLEQPQPIRDADGQLYFDGTLRLLSGPERIELPWWDSAGAVRDFFVAETASGARLWVFRERTSETETLQWWLQGVFG
ncbi:MAG: DNA polymerase Y family protein [Pseudomonadota bacterium]